MTPERAIEIIETAIVEVEWNYPLEYAVAFEVAIGALQKQIPKKPTKGSMFYICPSCARFIEKREHTHGNNIIPHCKWCGQLIDWSDTE